MTRLLPAEWRKEILQHLSVAPSPARSGARPRSRRAGCGAGAAPTTSPSAGSTSSASGQGLQRCQGDKPSAHPTASPSGQGLVPARGSILENTLQNTLGLPSPSVTHPLPTTLHEVQPSPSPKARPQSPQHFCPLACVFCCPSMSASCWDHPQPRHEHVAPVGSAEPQGHRGLGCL